MGKTRREAEARRRPVYRNTALRILVVCGSGQTERQYLEGLKAWQRNPAVSVKVLNKHRSPRQLVKFAEDCRDRYPDEFDEVWCLFDVDRFPDVADAARRARRSRINVAVSNPCFELWLLLHFTRRCAYLASYHEVVPLLRKHLPGYDKSALRFADYRERVGDACENAKVLDPTGEDVSRNPSTGV